MDLRAAIHAYMVREQIGQGEVAKRAKVSQSTVSRALKQEPIRSGRARTRLTIFMQERPEAGELTAVQTALTLVWDGSDAHADALAGLIAASRELWPGLGGREGDGGGRRAVKDTP